MTETKYLLLPQWHFDDKDGHPDFDIPLHFVKTFSSKKEIADYLNENDIKKELNRVKDEAFVERVNFLHLTGEERTNLLTRMFAYSDVILWVLSINPVGKDNRLGMMTRTMDKKQNKLVWKYVSYFGGKVWKDQLLFGVYR
jgi:hypothetical protein